MHILDLIFPPRCVNCNRVGSYLCRKCIQKIQYKPYQICGVCGRASIGGFTHPRCITPYGIDGLYAAAAYTGPVKKAIHFLKYRYVRDLTAPLVNLLFPKLPEWLPRFDYLVPVPLHPKRERERGFNQSYIIAKALGDLMNVPVKRHILIKKRITVPQVNLEKIERQRNLSHAFSVCSPNRIENKIIAVIDDVGTTNATVSECAKVLKRGGADAVWGIVLAHG